MNESISAIEIGDGRYVIIFDHIDEESALQLGRDISEWWEGDNKFLFITLGPGAAVRFERATGEE